MLFTWLHLITLPVVVTLESESFHFIFSLSLALLLCHFVEMKVNEELAEREKNGISPNVDEIHT